MKKVELNVCPAYNTAEEKPHAGFLTAKEAGKVLGLHPNTICWHIRQGHMSAILRRWYYGHETGRNLRFAYFIPIEEVKRYGMKKVIDKYARRTRWVRGADDPAIMSKGVSS